jgi:hypothetical protein
MSLSKTTNEPAIVYIYGKRDSGKEELRTPALKEKVLVEITGKH